MRIRNLQVTPSLLTLLQQVVEKPKTFVEKPIGGEKNGGTRKVRVKKLPAYYASQPNPKKRAKRVK